MKTSFRYEDKPSVLFKNLKRPIAEVEFWAEKRRRWLAYQMVVDTGADYSILPATFAKDLTIDLKRECVPIKTVGVGGAQKVFLLKKPITARIGRSQRKIPLGFLVKKRGDRHEIPPLLGRYRALDTFEVIFKNFQTIFEN